MEYKETEVLLEEDDSGGDNDTELSPDILVEDEELDFDSWPEELALDALNKKTKVAPGFSLEKRRAIEDYLEQRRLREEFDYEFENEQLFENADTTKSE